MAYFEINSVEVPIAEGSAQEADEQIGGSTRAQSGTLRWRVSARKRSWAIRSPELNRDDMDDLRDVLTDPDPLDITGDWIAATVFAELGAETPVPGDGSLWTLEYRLVEV